MSCRRVLKSIQALAAHTLLFCFTLFLVLKLDHTLSSSWWMVFLPLWAFHAVVARGRFSLPAPVAPRNRHWAPCHAVVATPLLVAFELLLCIYLESSYGSWPPAVSLKVASLPLLAFEVTILIDNLRMCRALMPGDDDSTSDEAIWEALPHLWVAISMVFTLAATFFTLLKLSGDIAALSWWDLFINIGIAECFAFLVCTKWSNPVIHRSSRARETASSSTSIRYLDWNSGLVVPPEEDRHQDRFCSLQDIGGHMLKIPVIVFQVVLCMHLEGTPERAKDISIPVLFSPLFLLQGLGVLFAASKLIEKIVVLLRGEAGPGLYFRFSSRAHDCLGFLHHGSRLLGWWSIDEGNREEQARLYIDGESGYNTFSGHPPEIVKKMPKEDLAEEVWRLQAALGEQTEIPHFKPMLEGVDWFSNQPQELHMLQSHHQDFRFLGGGFAFHQSVDSSSSFSPSQAFGLDMSHQPSFLAAANNNNPFDNNNAFEFGSDSGFLGHIQAPMGFGSLMQLGNNNSTPLCGGGGFTPLELEGFGSPASFVGSRAKVLKPLEVLASSGAQPTLFQKRAAMRQSSGMMRKLSDDGEMDETGVEVSGLNYESDELNESGKAAESVQNGGGGRGKKKGMPAKNLMAERRRRKKLNDRLYMLRSVVPKISKMDRASILGDAIDYLKELLQRINDLHNELESTPNGSLPPTSSSFHPLTPTPQTLSCRVKEELCPSSLPSPKGQQARVEVRLREGRAVNIHMFCGRRPGLLLDTMKALDNLGLDVQQAVISCFNGFALDVFRAEQCQEGQEILPDQIKAVLFDTAGYAGMI